MRIIVSGYTDPLLQCAKQCFAAAAFFALCSTAGATTFTFNTDPFAGTNVLNTPGRQIVGGEDFVSFNPATDLFVFQSPAFGVTVPVAFANGVTANLPASGVNVIVLESFDDDNNPLTPFGAPNAANLIASKVTTPGPGFFVYFNQSLDLPRLVFSEDLSSSTADLKILARILNLNGQLGKNTLPTFSAANFNIAASGVPEPSSLMMMMPLAAGACCFVTRRRRKRDAFQS